MATVVATVRCDDGCLRRPGRRGRHHRRTGRLGGHLLGFLAFAAVLAGFQRRAPQPVRTRFRTWLLAQGVSVWLVYGLAYELFGLLWTSPSAWSPSASPPGCCCAPRPGRAVPRAAGPSLFGAAAGLGAVAGMVPVILLAEPIDDVAMGGGMAPFLVIIALIGAVGGTCLGTILRPAGADRAARLGSPHDDADGRGWPADRPVPGVRLPGDRSTSRSSSSSASSAGGRAERCGFVVWLVMVPLAVLVHELGHAFVARTTGASPASISPDWAASRRTCRRSA